MPVFLYGLLKYKFGNRHFWSEGYKHLTPFAPNLMGLKKFICFTQKMQHFTQSVLTNLLIMIYLKGGSYVKVC